MAQRRSLFLLALFLVTFFGWNSRISAQAPEFDRLTLPDGGLAPVDFRADYVVTWLEGDTRIVGLSGDILIQQGTTQVRADEAFIWEKLTQPKNSPHDLTVYANGKVRVCLADKTTEHQTILAQWSTRGKSTLPAGKVDPVSVANRKGYKRALAIRDGKPTAPESLKIDFLPDSPDLPNNGIQPVQLVQPPAVQLDPPPGANLQPLPEPANPPLGTIGPSGAEPPRFQTPLLTLPPVNTRLLKIAPRTNVPNNAKYLNMNGEQVALITGGIKILALFPERKDMTLDIEADQVVIWQTGGGAESLMDSMKDKDGVVAGNDKHIEVYLSGNVVIRYGSAGDAKGPDGTPLDTKVLRGTGLLRCDQEYRPRLESGYGDGARDPVLRVSRPVKSTQRT